MRYHRLRFGSAQVVKQLKALAFIFTLIGVFLTAEVFSQESAVLSHESAIQVDLMSIGELRKNLKAFLKNSKRAAEPEIQNAAIINLCHLHSLVVSHPRYATSEALKGIRATAATRLSAFSKEFENAKKRSARNHRKIVNPSEDSHQVSSRFRIADSESGLETSPNRADITWPEGYDMANYASDSIHGGAGQFLSYLGGSFGPGGDHGLDLIALIENTIHPNYWRSNGGPGSMYYYRPGLALVVTASQEMHDRVESLLLRLR